MLQVRAFFTAVVIASLHRSANGLDFVFNLPGKLFYNTQHEIMLTNVQATVGERLTVTIQAQTGSRETLYSNQTLLVAQRPTETYSLPIRLTHSLTGCSPQSNGATTSNVLCEATFVVSVTTSSGQSWSRSQSVMILKTKAHIFIQTDRPVYLPGEKVYVRFAPVDELLRPLGIPMVMSIKAPNPTPGGSPLTSWSKTKAASRGIFTRAFMLPETPPLGKWVVSGKFRSDHVVDTTFQSTFYVQEFTIPTFDVIISPNAEHFILPDDEQFSFCVRARHIHGENVDGLAHIRFGLVLNGNDITSHIITHRDLSSGVVEITQQVPYLIPPSYNIGHIAASNVKLFIEATITEANGGKMRSIRNDDITFTTRPFVLMFERTPTYFKPGLPFSVKIGVKMVNGSFAAGVRVNVRATVLRRDGRVLNIFEQYVTSCSSGHVYASMIPPLNTKDLTITATAHYIPNSNQRYESQAQKTVRPQVSTHGEYIQIVQPNGDLVVGSMSALEIYVTPTSQAKTVIYTVTGGNKMLLQSSGEIPANNGMLTVPFTVSADMSPLSHMTAYYVGNTALDVSYIVADSIALHVEEVCKGIEPETNVLLPGEQIPLPGQQVDLDIRGQPSSYMSLSGVDMAALSLHHEYPSDTTMMTSYTRKNTFDILRSFQPGCKVPTIPTPEAAFPSIGRVLVTSASHNFLEATTVQCENENQSSRKKRSFFADPTIVLERSRYYSGDVYDCCSVGARDVSDVIHISGENSCSERANSLTVSAACRTAFMDCCLEAECVRLKPWKSARPCRGGVTTRTIFPVTTTIAMAGVPLVERSFELLRRNFALTWFNTDFQLGSSGRIRLNNASNPRVPRLPDSITSWSINTFSLSPDKGMCVARDVILPVEHSVHIEVTLSHTKVVRGTQVSVEVTAYSYSTSSIRASIILEPTDNLCTSSLNQVERDGTIAAAVNGVAGTMVTRFIILPTRQGDYKIKVALYAYHEDNQRPQIDKVVKVLNVVPEGILMKKVHWEMIDTRTTRIQRRGVRGNRRNKSINLSLPSSAIPGTERATLQLHSTTSAILTKPSFPGDDGTTNTIAQPLYQLQSIVSRLKYLQRNGLLTEGRREELSSEAQSAYVGLLTYVRNTSPAASDSTEAKFGFSFSPARSSKPDLWLSSASLRLLVQSAELISIDENILNGLVRWILSHQQKSPGRGYFAGKPIPTSRGSKRKRRKRSSSCSKLSKSRTRCKKRRNAYDSNRKYKKWQKKCRKRLRKCRRRKRNAEALLKLPQFASSLDRKIYRTSVIGIELHVIYTTIEAWETRERSDQEEATRNGNPLIGFNTSPIRSSVRKATNYIKRQIRRAPSSITSPITMVSAGKMLYMSARKVFDIVDSAVTNYIITSADETTAHIRSNPSLEQRRLNMEDLRTDSTRVEATAYQLHLLTLRDRSPAPYANWLIQNRNENGRWVSLRDSLAASQALNEYAMRQRTDAHPPISLEVNTHTGGQVISATNIHQPSEASKAEIAVTNNEVSVTSVGDGVGWLELNVEYSVPRTSSLFSSPSAMATTEREEIQYCPYNIEVRIDVAQVSSSYYTLRQARRSSTAWRVSLVVTNKTGEDLSESNDQSYIMEFGLHGDYYPYIEDLEMLYNPVERTLDHYKVTKRAVIFYMTGPKNISFRISDTTSSFADKPIPVTIYPSAFPERKCTTYYNQRGPSNLTTLCSADNGSSLTSSDICVCASAQTCPAIISRRTSRTEPVETKIQRSCKETNKYAHRVKILSKTRVGEDWNLLRGRIIRMFRTSPELSSIQNNQVHTFWAKITCNIANIQVNKEYLITGATVVQGNDGVYKYLLESSTHVDWWPQKQCERIRKPSIREICDKMTLYSYTMSATGCT
uniref:complement C3-like isoform X2 n=1 Tax=Ciona intestinalis TaxID=7719 RepID=UPI000EF513B8|nr:complement C3-like isoform X2 [Ciona intestinalis]|eukprot:XP_026692819.1 complement C3-like isoform X2 [Ciona intestinalis]